MSDPVESKQQQIVEYINSVLILMVKTDGYWNNLGEDQVTDDMLGIEQIDEAQMPFVIIDPGAAKEDTIGSDKSYWEMSLILLGFTITNESDRTQRDIRRFASDVLKRVRIKADGTLSPDLNCNVNSAKIMSIRTDGGLIGHPDIGVFEIEMELKYSLPYGSQGKV